MERDGTKRAGTRVTSPKSRGTANADGVIATGHGHFTHAVKVWRLVFTQIGEVTDFLNIDEVQFWSPCDLHTGSSGDFFGYDSNRNRFVRVSPQAKLVAAYSLEAAGLKTVTKLARFRVWEPWERFFVRFENELTLAPRTQMNCRVSGGFGGTIGVSLESATLMLLSGSVMSCKRSVLVK